MLPLHYRKPLWASVPLGPLARTAVLQLLAGLLILRQTESGSHNRAAVISMCSLGLLTLPLARLAARLSRDHPSVYWWSGRVWAALLPATFSETVARAFDGTGALFAERVCSPFGLAAVIGICFAIGAQGALFSVPRDLAINMVVIMLAMSATKLRIAYTYAYLMLHVTALGALALGYVCVTKYADLHEAMRDAAEAVVVGAAARESFAVTDFTLHTLAVNQRLLDVLGYDEQELVGQPVTKLVTEGADLANDHAWVRRTLFEAASRNENPNGHVWSLHAKNGTEHPVRITLGEARCPTSGIKMFTAMFSCMRLEQRNAQLQCEKERLQWEVASHHDGEEDPRERLGATVAIPVNLECHECALDECRLHTTPHRTLGAMQDQATTDEAVSCANSFDHVNSNASPTLPRRPLVAPEPPKSATSSGTSIVTLKSSVMDTVSRAAKKSPTRAPPPPKSTHLSRPKKTSSEPSPVTKPKAGNAKRARAQPLPPVEADPRECS